MSRLTKIFFFLSLMSVFAFVVIRFLVGGFIPFLWIPLALALFFFLGFLWLSRKHLSEFLSMRTTKHGMSAGMLILVSLGLLFTFNFLAVRYNKTFDISMDKIHSLSPQTVQILGELKGELLIRYFYQEGAEGAEANKRLLQGLVKKYQDLSSLVKMEFVEVNKRPDLVSQYGVNKGSGTLFIDYQGKRSRIEAVSEKDLTAAIHNNLKKGDHRIYVVTNHGEGSLENSQEATGLAAFKALLEGNRFVVLPLDLVASPKVPSDAGVLVLPGAKQDYFKEEILAIEAFLQSGGAVLLLQDPGFTRSLDPLLAKVGLTFENNYIVRPELLQFRVFEIPFNGFNESQKITKALGESEGALLFRLAQSIKVQSPSPNGITNEELLFTEGDYYAFKDLSFKNQGETRRFTLGVLSTGVFPGQAQSVSQNGQQEGGSKNYSLVVLGDSDFIGNQLLYKNLNRDLILNTLNFLVKEESSISITPKEPSVTKLELTDHRFYLFVFALVIPLPLVLLSLAGVFWYRRRSA